VEQCVNTGAVRGGAQDRFVGGIAGYGQSQNGGSVVVRNCYNTGTVSGGNCVGGLVGQLWSRGEGRFTLMENCYNTGAVTADSYQDGIVGRIGTENEAAATVTVQNCYGLNMSGVPNITIYDGPGTETITNVKHLSGSQAAQQSNFIGFDFDTVWYCAGDGSYPVLIVSKLTGQMGGMVEFSGYAAGPIEVTAADDLDEAFIYVMLASYEQERMVGFDVVKLSAGETEHMKLEKWGDNVKMFVLSEDFDPHCDLKEI